MMAETCLKWIHSLKECQREIQAEYGFNGEPDVHIDELPYEIFTEALGNSPGRLMHGPQINKKQALTD